MTGGTSSRYITYRIDDISSLIGKRIRIEADIKPSNNVALGIFPHNPEGYVNKTRKWFRDDGTVYFDVTLSDNTIDHILFRVYVNTDYATVELQNIKIYPV